MSKEKPHRVEVQVIWKNVDYQLRIGRNVFSGMDQHEFQKYICSIFKANGRDYEFVPVFDGPIDDDTRSEVRGLFGHVNWRVNQRSGREAFAMN